MLELRAVESLGRLWWLKVTLNFSIRSLLFLGYQLCLNPGEVILGQGKFGADVQGLCKNRGRLLVKPELCQRPPEVVIGVSKCRNEFGRLPITERRV